MSDPEYREEKSDNLLNHDSLDTKGGAPFASRDTGQESDQFPSGQSPVPSEVTGPYNSLSFLAEVASDPQHFALAEPHPSWRLASTSRSLPPNHPHHQEISDDLLLQFDFDEKELFQIQGGIVYLSGSLSSLNLLDQAEEEPEAKRKRRQLPKTSFSSFEDTTSSSSSSSPQSPSIPLTIDDIDESSRPLKTELDVGITSFWKYRQIPKGPQGQIFDRQVHLQTDPTQPLKFQDPAFVESSAASNLSHFGKARIGEGNDTTPNPQKLVKIGLEVREISKKMKALSNKAQEREKAKLSSNHCRLRKIANNEANKIIFNGMEKEKEELTNTLKRVRETIDSHQMDYNVRLSDKVNTVISEFYHTRVAGQAGVYVDGVLATHGYTSE